MSSKNKRVVDLRVGMSGHFRADIHKVLGIDYAGNMILGARVGGCGWQDNLILNSGLDLLAAPPSDLMGYVQVGTSSTPPAVGQTGLLARVAGAEKTEEVSTGQGSSSYAYRRVRYRIPAGTAANKNLAELGVGAGATGGTLTRALFKDSSGNPATLTLGSDEVLDITYELRAYIPQAAVSGEFTINGITTAVTVRPLWSVAAWTGRRLGISSMGMRPTSAPNSRIYLAWNVHELPQIAPPSWRNDLMGTGKLAAYVPGTFYLNGTLEIPLNSGNFAGNIGGATFGSTSSAASGSIGEDVFGSWGVEFSPPIKKTSTMTAEIRFRVGWGRQVP